MHFSSVAVTAALAAVSSLVTGARAADLPSITVKGKYFFYPNGTRFYIKGIAYQQDVTGSSSSSFTDPLADADGCKRDIPYLEKLGINTIRTYAINTTEDHSECMSMLQDAGIYVISDLSEPGISIDRDDPSWNLRILDRYTQVVDALANYTNVLGFFAGNEVTNSPNTTSAAPFVKAAVRDLRTYIEGYSSSGGRSIPIGYSTDDDAQTRDQLAAYFSCGDNSTTVDFFGVNIYEWCGDSSYESSGYEARTKEFSSFDIPLFFSEYGCNTVQPRKFTEVQALYGDEMTPVWSGGIVYMYFQETNDYGVVSVSGDTVSTLEDYNYFSSQLHNITPASLAESTYTPSTGTGQSCPTTDSNWSAATKLPGTPSDALCECMYDSLSCVAKSDLSSKEISELFSEVCGYEGSNCDGISANGTYPGTYGTYAVCNNLQQLSYIMNSYYEAQDKDSSACDFDGSASTQDAKTASSCTAWLSTAGSSATGILTDVPVGTVSASESDSTGSSDSSDSSGSGSSASATGSAASASSTSDSSSAGAVSMPASYSAPLAFAVAVISAVAGGTLFAL